jgi:L-ascorbate metabolism protein UlaG (beta-lactamase superfamily)
MKLTFYGHATFSIDVQGKKILFDPFFTGNPLATDINPESIEADFIFVSHGHSDHTADLVNIAKKTNAQCIVPAEMAGWLHKQGVAHALPMNHGSYINFPFGKVRGVSAIHSSSLPDGTYAGNPLGFVFSTPEGDFYYAGDTSLTLDMQLIPLWANLSFAVLPIGGHFTMDVTDALYASNFVKTDKVVGVHYDTFGFIKIDSEAAVKTFADAGKTLLLPAVCETIEL